MEWFEKAAAGGLSAAQVQLARLYSSGDGVPRDPARAAKLLEKAADKGDLDAKTDLADGVSAR